VDGRQPEKIASEAQSVLRWEF